MLPKVLRTTYVTRARIMDNDFRPINLCCNVSSDEILERKPGP